MRPIDEAYRMLDTFASVGARHFDVTFLDIDGAKRGFRKGQSVMQLRNSLPKLLPGLTERRNSLIIRPENHFRGLTEMVTLVQLDDLDAAALKRLESVAFLTHSTSPGNYQAWVAVSGALDKDIGRRLRKAVGADLSASGATRIAGAVNYKRKYEPDFPTVAIVDAHPGRIVTPEQLEQLGLIGLPEPAKAYAPHRVSSRSGGSLPDYQRCIDGAPMNNGKDGPDISRADYFWALMSAQRGNSIEEIATRLMELSSKAKENGEQYARLTAENATAAAERGKQRSRA